MKKRVKGLDIYKKALTLRGMKVTHHHLKLRSVFSTIKIGHQIHRPKKGAGSYSRKNQRISND
jgi:hypothetical protein